MINNGFYKLNDIGIQFLKDNNCQIAVDDNSKIDNRPNYFAFTSKDNSKIVYLIPVTTIRTQKKMEYIDNCISSKGLKSSYFVRYNMDGVEKAFKVSSVFAVSISMIDEWTLRGIIYKVNDRNVITNTNKHLKIMLNYYSSFPERSENHVIEVRNTLISMLTNEEPTRVSDILSKDIVSEKEPILTVVQTLEDNKSFG